MIVRVLPAEAAIDKLFDYAVPDGVAVDLGDEVRIELNGRRMGGWVVELAVEPPAGVVARPLSKRRGIGPSDDVLDLAAWAAWRWAGRWAHLVGTASPPVAVRGLPPAALGHGRSLDLGDEASALAASALAGPGTTVVRLPPTTSPRVVIDPAAALGPTLVVVPTQHAAAALAARLRSDGWPVALLPGDWALARAGRSIVIGTRSAAFAPCPGLTSVIVLDADDESLQSEAAPTWSAVEVAAERARRSGVPCLLVSAAPSPTLVADRPVVGVSERSERERWARVEVVDRVDDDPRAGLYGEVLARRAAEADRAVFVLNRTGRARRLTCRKCGEAACCSTCSAACAEAADGSATLVCQRCGTTRPRVCQRCGGLAMKAFRQGVSRVREELEALLGRPVAEVTAATEGWPDSQVVVGTEAVLGRAVGTGRVDLVAFLDLDGDLLAPRVTAVDHVLGLLAAASRLVGQRRKPDDGRVLVQTRHASHPVLAAIAAGNPDAVVADELQLRRALGLVPFRRVARISGAGAAELLEAARLGRPAGVDVVPVGADGAGLVLAPDPGVLADLLEALPRPAAKVRVEVDPPRQ